MSVFELTQAVLELDEARNFRQQLKIEWAEMWRSKLDDKMMAETMSKQDFKWLFVDQGQILYASRDFKALSFGEIIEKYMGQDILDKISPDPSIGGWKRFAREKFSTPIKRPRKSIAVEADPRQQSKQSGRGWLNSKGRSR